MCLERTPTPEWATSPPLPASSVARSMAIFPRASTWFGHSRNVQAQEHDPASTLALYRQALSWRRKLQAAESLEGMPATNGQVLHFGRPAAGDR